MRGGAFFRLGADGDKTGRGGAVLGLIAWFSLAAFLSIGATIVVAIVNSLAGLSWRTPAAQLPFALSLFQFTLSALAPIAAACVVTRSWFGRPVLTLVTTRPRFHAGSVLGPGLLWAALLLADVLFWMALTVERPTLQLDPLRFLLWAPLIVLFALLQAGGEELLFRGFLMQTLARLVPIGVVIVLVSLFFGVLHLQYGWPGKAGSAMLGLLFVWLAWRDGSLERAIGVHVANNAFVILLLGRDERFGASPTIFEHHTVNPDWPQLVMLAARIGLFLLIADYVWPLVRRRIATSSAPIPAQPA